MMRKTGGIFQNRLSGRGIADSFLLHHRWLLPAHAGQSLLNPAREFLLPGQLDFGVFLGHPDRTVAGDL
jgi:hypothetical protein